MSADNYLLVRRHPAGGWTVTQEFASDDEFSELRLGVPRFQTRDEATDFAYELEETDYYEYGVRFERE